MGDINDKGKSRRDIWFKVKTSFEIRIINGDFIGGEGVITIDELAEQYDISKSTAAKVFESLCEDGILYGKKRWGHFLQPFSKQKLLEKHTEVLKDKIRDVLKYANEIGIDEIAIADMLKDLSSPPHREEIQ